MMIGDPGAPKGKMHNGMMTRSAWQPLPGQMRPTETLSMPSTAREAKEARARAKVKVKARARMVRERMMQPPKPTSRRPKRGQEHKHVGVTTASNTDTWAKIANNQTAARPLEQPLAALRRQRVKRAVKVASAVSHRPREG